MNNRRNVRRYSQPSSIATCTDRLLMNDPAFVELSLERLGENFNVMDFVHAIRVNQTVQHVCFSGTFVRELPMQTWHVMLQAMGHLQPLREMQIWCSTIPVHVLAQTLRHAVKLQKVYFFRVGLAGNPADFDDLAVSIRHHPSLRDVRIGGFHIVSTAAAAAPPLVVGAAGGVDAAADVDGGADVDGAVDVDGGADAAAVRGETISLGSTVEAMAVAPHLEVVSLRLSGAQRQVPFGRTALARLLASTSITDLYLSRLGLGKDHISVLARALATNNTLCVLDLFGNHVENEHVILMAQSLEKNTSLLTLVLPCPTSEDLSVASCAAISQALKINKTLVTLNLPRSNLSDEGISHLAQGLIVNTTLKKVEVGVSKNVGDAGMQALLDMLDKNYELERIVVSSSDRSIKKKTEYYMRLNEVGRGVLLRNHGKATREQWVEMLISVSNDLECLFYFLTVNPTLCQFANVGQAEVIITEEIRISRRHTMDHNYFSNTNRPSMNSLDAEESEMAATAKRRASAF